MLAEGNGGPEDANDPNPSDGVGEGSKFFRGQSREPGEDGKGGVEGGEGVARLIGEDEPLINGWGGIKVDGLPGHSIWKKEEDEVGKEGRPENAGNVAFVGPIFDAEADPAKKAVEGEVEPEPVEVDRDGEIEAARGDPVDGAERDVLNEAVGDDDPEHRKHAAGRAAEDEVAEIGEGSGQMDGCGSGACRVQKDRCRIIFG